MDHHIFVFLQPWIHRFNDLYKKSPKLASNLLLFGPQLCPAIFPQIFISPPPQIYVSPDIHVFTSIVPQIPSICRSSDPSVTTSMAPWSSDVYIHRSSNPSTSTSMMSPHILDLIDLHISIIMH